MKKNTQTLMVLAVFATGLAASGCTTLSKSYPVNSPTVEILPLHRNEYKILGDTEGKACAKYLLGGKLPWFSSTPSKSVNQPGSATGFLASLPLIGGLFGGKTAVVNEALYEALEKIPSTDSLMSMRVSMHKRFSIPLFYKDECATVKGKAFKIKVDKK